MKGLLTKDFRILAGQKRYFTIIILIAAIFLCSGQPAQIIVGWTVDICLPECGKRTVIAC